ncbi:ABC transporter ATP-binding protein/permease [Georgenia satyanarayanai]|uniref:ABC transporter ATP-binding protein n=1 Tax=Georgenia satyanarayanai TaxID=860221 RepID=UPI00203F447F|nr:ABC transporter ATP-binding protein [Georgenia satyanarayanai]MCM3661067.1 ABC transporter ATP-binding protein/permease [Georgenia satyanarayanai]
MKRLWAALKELLPLLPPSSRRFLVTFAVATSSLALLDIAALGLLALTMTPLVQGRPLSLPVIGEVPTEYTVWILVVVCALIVLKSVLSITLQWFATRRFAAYELLIGDRLFAAYIQAPWTERLRRNSAELVRLADVGIGNTTSGLLLPAASLPAEAVTFVAVLAVLVVAEPVTAAITLVYLGIIAAVLYFVISRRAVVAGRVNRDYSFRVATLMTEMVATLKEITLRNKAGEVAQVVHRNRIHTTRARANIQFLNAVPKFVIEAALIGGFVLVGAAAYLQGGSASALGAVALFAVAGFRMVPSVTRFQGIITLTSSTIPHANAVIRDIKLAERYTDGPEQVGTGKLRHLPELLRLRDVEFAYPGADAPAVTGIDLDVRMGSSLALVGASGAGKSTLVDIFLGLLVPSSGTITIDGQPLVDVLADWRTKVGYVPQDVSLFDATIAQNVALSWDSEIDEDRVRDALARAQLLDVVEERAGGLHARIGERGMALSGGQRQRLGIARALYSDPIVLVMDEATSALDTATEEAVARAIRDLHGDVTVISVAHRLSTIRHSDQVCFMRDARIVARGTFDEVVAAEPDFAYQASLAGLA